MRERCDYSIFFEDRLVARVWQREDPGEFFVHVGQADQKLREVVFADIELLSRRHRPLLEAALDQVKDLETWLFKLKLENFRIHEGEIHPEAHRRRF